MSQAERPSFLPRPSVLALAVACGCLSPSLALPGANSASSAYGQARDEASISDKGTARATTFSLRTSSGNTWALADHAGKVVVMEWIDPECPMVARQHSPEGTIHLVANQTKEEPGIAWVAINSSYGGYPQSSVEATEAVRERLQIEYPALLDPTGWVARAYGVKRAAHIIVVGEQGRVVYSGAPDNRASKSLLLDAIKVARGQVGGPLQPMEAYGCAVRFARGTRVGSALPPFTFPTGSGSTLSSTTLLGQPYVMEWSNPSSQAWKDAHGESGALTKEPTAWREAGAQWLLVHPCPAVDGKELGIQHEKSAEEKLSAACPSGRTIHDRGHRLTDRFGATAVPEIFIVDRRGVLVYAGAHDANADAGGLVLAEARKALFDSELHWEPQESSPSGDAIEP